MRAGTPKKHRDSDVSDAQGIKWRNTQQQETGKKYTNDTSEQYRMQNSFIADDPENDSQKSAWNKVQVTGYLPERRSNMAGCVADDGYLYIYGGQDLKEGLLNSLWRINLAEAVEGSTEWQNMTHECKNMNHFSYSHHCGVCWKGKIYYFGGSRQYSGPFLRFDRTKAKTQNALPQTINIFDTKTLTWSTGPRLEVHRDDFAWTFDKSRGRLYIFGGFLLTGKTNDLICLNLETLEFEQLDLGSSRPASATSQQSMNRMGIKYPVTSLTEIDPHRPVPLTGARMTYCQADGCLYLFGGQNSNAETVNDFWRYSFGMKQWQRMNPKGVVPQPRSGHTLICVEKSLIMFGGLIEITKECNDTYKYDMLQNTWEVLDLCPNIKDSKLPAQISTTDDKDVSMHRRQTFQNVMQRSQTNKSSSTPGPVKSSTGLGLTNKSDTKLDVTPLSRNCYSSTAMRAKKSQLGLSRCEYSQYVMRQNPCANPKPGPIPYLRPLTDVRREIRMKRFKGESLPFLDTPIGGSSMMTPSGTKSGMKLVSPMNSTMPSNVKPKQDDLNKDLKLSNTGPVAEMKRDSPTNISMRSTFIFKNHNNSFEKYFQEMKKRNTARGFLTTPTGHAYRSNESGMGNQQYWYQQNKSFKPSSLPPQFPTARDGHFSAIYDSQFLVIFGGDRHMMSFNDLFYINLRDMQVI